MPSVHPQSVSSSANSGSNAESTASQEIITNYSDKGSGSQSPRASRIQEQKRVKIIGADLHIMNPLLVQAVKERNSDRVVALARDQVEAGAQGLVVNLGTCRWLTARTAWLIECLQEITTVDLLLSSHVLADPAVLKSCRLRVIVNAVTGDPRTLPQHLRQAAACGVGLVVLLSRPGQVVAAVDDRLELAATVLATADEVGFPRQHLWLDPLLQLHPDPHSWALGRGVPAMHPVLETIRLLPELVGSPVQTILSLEAMDAIADRKERSRLQVILLGLLRKVGASAVIMDCHDPFLVAAAQGRDLEETAPVATANPATAMGLDLATLPW